jgi:hypothetical protein
MPVTHLNQLPVGFGFSVGRMDGGGGVGGEDTEEVELAPFLFSSFGDPLPHLNHLQ